MADTENVPLSPVTHGSLDEMPNGQKPLGRPSDYTTGTVDLICERIAQGESLRGICRDEEMPAQSTVFKWLREHTEFSEQYARAREAQADALFDDILEIADDARNDWMERRGEDDAGWTANGDHIQRSKLRIEARKWMAMKLQPKKYGEKQSIDVTFNHEDALEQLK